jgi:hypothetical protein
MPWEPDPELRQLLEMQATESANPEWSNCSAATGGASSMNLPPEALWEAH